MAMKLRKEIEPDFTTVERLYPEILKLILAYTNYCDENGDEDNFEYKKLENRLHEMTGKDISKYNLFEWWEEEGIEVLAFKISLPTPKIIRHITKEELIEIIRRIKTFVTQDENNENLKERFIYHTYEYFIDFLKLNFKSANYELFQRKKDKNGNYFEYTQEEIVEKLWRENKNSR